MRHYLTNNLENSIQNCLDKRKGLFWAGEIRLRMVKEETPQQMEIFIQFKAVFISIYLEMSFFPLYSFIQHSAFMRGIYLVDAN